MKHTIKHFFILVLALGVLGGTRSSARELPALQVAVNQSLVFRLVEKAKRISVAQPEIAEVIVAEPNQLVLNGKAVGITSLIVWDDKGQFTNFTVIVTSDIATLRQQLKTLFPEETIEVSTSGLGIVLQGEVANEVIYDKVIALTRNYLPPKPPQDVAPAPATTTTFTIGEGVRLPTTGTAFAGGGELAFVEEGGVTDSRRWKDKRGIPEIIDLLKIRNFRQVELKVIVAEVSLTKLREIGLDFSVLGSTTGFTSGAGSQGGFSGVLGSALLTYVSGPTRVAVLWRLFQNRAVTHIMAQPNLVIKNGRAGGFLAGGEFPYPVPQSSGLGVDTITIEFKPFGVRLDFLPTITWSNEIDLRIFPEVSELDERTSVQFGGFNIPGLRVRRTVSRVQIAEGDTLILSGLLERRSIRQLTKLPLLGDIPLIGGVFRATRFRDDETELIFVITPTIVNALRPGQRPKLPSARKYDSPDMRQIPLPGNFNPRIPKRTRSGPSMP